jgi:hypothetical protein
MNQNPTPPQNDPADRTIPPAEVAAGEAPELTPEQQHFLEMQERAQVLACRTGSCGG